MQLRFVSVWVFGITVVMAINAEARVNVVVVRSDASESKAAPSRQVAPPPSATDAAKDAKIVIVDGIRDENGGGVEKLIDGNVPSQPDQPAENFFFASGNSGGRLLIDLGESIMIDQVNTYSRHPTTRGPQVYNLYASDGLDNGFQLEPKRKTDPKKVGWTLIADVDTRRMESDPGGKYGVSIFDSDGPVGEFRYLLFDMYRTENDDPFGNTFYSEIDVVASSVTPSDAPARVSSYTTSAGQKFTVDTSKSPALTEWADKELAPVVKEWYPKIANLLCGEGSTAPNSFDITFTPTMRGIAATGGTHIRCGEKWFRRNLQGEAKGAVVHELVHVVQQYKWPRQAEGTQTPPPGWLVEGIADYVRWFNYEPQSRGAEIRSPQAAAVRYDDSYRVSANFLNWVAERYDANIVKKLNAALREGQYREELWSEWTGKPVEELGKEWKLTIGSPISSEGSAKAIAAVAANAQTPERAVNKLTDQEAAEGWRLLFNGSDFSGWHNFGKTGVQPGWQVDDGSLACADPHNAGDLCTDDEFEWFELKLDFKISEGGNSGIMYRVSESGAAPWETGPEFQLEDNAKARDPIRCGWLYALYQPPNDPRTDKPIDATKPAGEWNDARLVISPQKCIHEINGVKYFEYVLGSDDFQGRVAQSKFRTMPRFAKIPRGVIAPQGDHGQVSFRNIKIRPIVKP